MVFGCGVEGAAAKACAGKLGIFLFGGGGGLHWASGCACGFVPHAQTLELLGEFRLKVQVVMLKKSCYVCSQCFSRRIQRQNKVRDT